MASTAMDERMIPRTDPGPAVRAIGYQHLARVLRDYSKAMTCPACVVWRAESFRASEDQPMTLRRAKALNAVLERCYLPAVPGELLVGAGNLARFIETGSIADEVIRASRKCLDEQVGRRTFVTHADHHAPDYAKLLHVGFAGLKAEVRHHLSRADERGKVFLDSMLVALEGASRHLLRWSRHLADFVTEHPAHAELLNRQSQMLAKLAEQPPQGFHEALQLVLMYHYLMQLDDRYAMALGRLDQYLYPFYSADLASGILSQDQAQDLLDHLFAKVTVDGDVQNIALGGVKPADGSDATNELSYMILEACRRVGRAGGNCTARIHSRTPRAFLDKCAQVIRTGIGYPSVYNDEIEIPALLRQGYALEDARNYCFVGCIEVFMQGKQAPWADDRLSPAYCLNLALFDGVDILTGQQSGPQTGEPADFESFYQSFLVQCRHDLQRRIEQANAQQRNCDDRPDDFTSPLMSALTSDCIVRGRDLNAGGAIYPANNGYALMGIGTVADSLAAMKKLVFEQKRFTLDQLRTMLKADFVGYEKERQVLLRAAPKYGNDDNEVDALAVRFVEDYAGSFDAYRNPQGGHYWALMGSNISNIWGGTLLGATPDGRRAKTPLSDAASPTFGRDVNGPTATVRSIAKLPYGRCVGGNVVNMKLHPTSLEGEAGITALSALIRTCFDLGGSELQFNTTDRGVLEKAMEHPEQHEDLVVRVSGFSANFVWLDRAVQKDILARTEHRLQ